MPEGHTLHRLARDQTAMFAGTVVHASSPQGRFADGAATLDGRVVERVEAYGKHLFQHWSGNEALHVHLGLYGEFRTGKGAPPEPRGALRLRLVNDEVWTDLRGPIACELVTAGEIDDIVAKLGPDPIRRGSDPGLAFARIQRSKTSIAALLMDQKVLAGVGNVYRAEVLFRHGVDPYLPGNALPEPVWLEMWADLVVLMRAGVRAGRIVTTRMEDRTRPGRITRGDAVYVYRRTGQPCRICGTEIRTAVLVGRNLFWCPYCQR